MRTTRAQRSVVFISLGLTAVLLVITMCDWTYADFTRGRLVLIGRTSNTRTTTTITGITTAPGVSRATSVVLGLVVPTLLVGTGLYLFFGWRQQIRVAAGLCPRCGYDLRGDGVARATECPECGWQRNAP